MSSLVTLTGHSHCHWYCDAVVAVVDVVIDAEYNVCTVCCVRPFMSVVERVIE